MAQLDLSAADREAYLEDGFLVLRGVWTADDAARCRTRLLRQLGGGDIPPGALRGSAGNYASQLGVNTSAPSVRGSGSVIYNDACVRRNALPSRQPPPSMCPSVDSVGGGHRRASTQRIRRAWSSCRA